MTPFIRPHNIPAGGFPLEVIPLREDRHDSGIFAAAARDDALPNSCFNFSVCENAGSNAAAGRKGNGAHDRI